MPTLNWIGKDAVVKHHQDVPFRLLEPVPEPSCGEPDSGNLIVQGDHLDALKALLPCQAAKVKCIYIDPPYNTGNEGWVYNDNVDSPEIRRWLGQVVGKEGEPLDRHDRWLCMIYPRLVLLKQFLSADGAIFVSIDDNEGAALRLLMDEVFGANGLKALAEGWDCPFAYILVSMASLSSATAVEPLLGRVLRQYGANHRRARALNQSYAFVVSQHFAETAAALRDRLVAGAGFQRREVADFVTAAKAEQARLDLDSRAGRVVVYPGVITLTEKPNLKAVPKPLRDKLTWDRQSNTLTITTPLTEEETIALTQSVTSDASAAAIAEAGQISRTTAIEFFQTPAERGERLRVPQLALRVRGQLALFDDPEVLEYPWELSTYDATLTPAEVDALAAGRKFSEGGEIDVDADSGQIVSRFLPDLQRDLGLVWRPEHWDPVRLATWLCENVPEPTLTHASKRAFGGVVARPPAAARLQPGRGQPAEVSAPRSA